MLDRDNADYIRENWHKINVPLFGVAYAYAAPNKGISIFYGYMSPLMFRVLKKRQNSMLFQGLKVISDFQSRFNQETFQLSTASIV